MNFGGHSLANICPSINTLQISKKFHFKTQVSLVGISISDTLGFSTFFLWYWMNNWLVDWMVGWSVQSREEHIKRTPWSLAQVIISAISCSEAHKVPHLCWGCLALATGTLLRLCVKYHTTSSPGDSCSGIPEDRCTGVANVNTAVFNAGGACGHLLSSWFGECHFPAFLHHTSTFPTFIHCTWFSKFA